MVAGSCRRLRPGVGPTLGRLKPSSGLCFRSTDVAPAAPVRAASRTSSTVSAFGAVAGAGDRCLTASATGHQGERCLRVEEPADQPGRTARSMCTRRGSPTSRRDHFRCRPGRLARLDDEGIKSRGGPTPAPVAGSSPAAGSVAARAAADPPPGLAHLGDRGPVLLHASGVQSAGTGESAGYPCRVDGAPARSRAGADPASCRRRAARSATGHATQNDGERAVGARIPLVGARQAHSAVLGSGSGSGSATFAGAGASRRSAAMPRSTRPRNR